MKSFQEFISEMLIVGGKYKTALQKHYSVIGAAHFKTLADHKNHALKTAHDIIKDTNPSKTDDQIHNLLVKHFTG